MPAWRQSRLPGKVIGVESIFGLSDQGLSIHYEAGASAQPHVDEVMLAIRKVSASRV